MRQAPRIWDFKEKKKKNNKYHETPLKAETDNTVTQK